MTTAYFTGEVKWAKVFKPDEKYGKYCIDVLLDMKQFKEMKDLGLKNGGKPDDSGKMWVTFRRNKEDGAPRVVDNNGSPTTGAIGNGSSCTVKIEVETFTSKKYGKITRSTMTDVRVDSLVVYDPDKKEETAVAAQATTAPPSTPRPRIPF